MSKLDLEQIIAQLNIIPFLEAQEGLPKTEKGGMRTVRSVRVVKNYGLVLTVRKRRVEVL